MNWLKQKWQWVKSKWKHFLIGTGIILVASAAGTALLPEQIPINLQLKTAKENILYSQEFLDEGIPTIAYAYKSGELAPVLDNEIIEQRTPHIVYRNLGGNKRSAQSGYDFYQENDNWYKTKFATTTKEVFDKATVSFIEKVFAADTGATSPGTMADITGGTGSNPEWYDIDYAKTADTNSAISYPTVGGIAHSNYLKATNFGFTVPSDSVISGILVEIAKYQDTALPEGAGIKDYAVRIVKGNTIGETDKSNVSQWSTTKSYISYGSSSDLWGETWTYEDINVSTFGMAISLTGERVYEGPGYIDHIRITVYYTEGAPPAGGGSIESDLILFE